MSKSLTEWLRSLVGPPAPGAAASIGDRLRELERRAESREDGLAGVPLNRAGDLCFEAGDRARALEYYGRAIDTFLEEGHPESARAVAQKIIRLHPGAVRALCTLTWLDLGTGHRGDAPGHLAAYVTAAERSGDEARAAGQILEMARVVDAPAFREAAAEALGQLGFPADEARVRGWLEAGGEAPEAATAEELPGICFTAAVRSNGRRRGGEAA